jgi:Fe-S cluster assembly ATP-binding protein
MLKLTNLTITTHGKTVIDDLDLNLDAGEIHVLMGPNGAGKSSLAQALMGHPQYEIVRGRFDLNNQDLTPLDVTGRAQAGLFLAFQTPIGIDGVSVQNFLKAAYDSLHPHLPVSQFRETLYAWAEKLAIPKEFLSRALSDGFSGGEKKRLEILQLLILKPQYAILDEPDSGLDLDALKLIAQSIELATTQNHTGILLITHYPRLLEHLKPSVISIMLTGHLVKTGGLELLQQIETQGYQSYVI